MVEKMGELAILVEAIGVEKSIEALKKAQTQMEKGQDKSKKNAKALTDFATKFGGAMAIVTASLSAAAFGLLTQMPVMQEIFGALEYIVQTLAYVLDSVLRPLLEPLANLFYKIGDAIETLPPFFKNMIAAVVATTAGLTVLATIVIALIALFASGIGEAAAIVIAIFAALLVVVLVVAAVVGVLYEAWKENWFGIRDLTAQVWDDWLKPIFLDIVAKIAWLKKAWDTDFMYIRTITMTVFAAIVTAITFAVSVISMALNFLKGIFESLPTPIQEILKSSASFAAILVLVGGLILVVVVALSILAPIIVVVVALFALFAVIVSVVMTLFTALVAAIAAVGVALYALYAVWLIVWGGMKSFASTTVSEIKGFITDLSSSMGAMANPAIDALNAVISGLNSISVTIPDWVPVYGGKSWSMAIPTIPSLKSEGIVTRTGQAEVHAGEGVFAMRSLEEAMFNAITRSGMSGGQNGNVIYMDRDRLTRSLDGGSRYNMAARGGSY